MNTPILPPSPAASTATRQSPVYPPPGKELVLKVCPMPADTNFNGDIFGGWVMSQVDLAGGVLPSRIIKGKLVTVAVKEFIFKQPVRPGDLVVFYANIQRIGNTSITVDVEVFSERVKTDEGFVKVTEATLTYVAIGEDGKPRQIHHP